MYYSADEYVTIIAAIITEYGWIDFCYIRCSSIVISVIFVISTKVEIFVSVIVDPRSESGMTGEKGTKKKTPTCRGAHSASQSDFALLVLLEHNGKDPQSSWE